ncbi:hypothetical protein CHS0354_013904 [Potamilus streckersoni]|uniref:Uncharacterized protein n=1 Tax=Potamilus streckersoni TaxID=2493646 RepID=A0AAE0VLE6_9BIVA|nr:hypothetical protein CHS0354_013904 [Potamilus streckersoni]
MKITPIITKVIGQACKCRLKDRQCHNIISLANDEKGAVSDHKYLPWIRDTKDGKVSEESVAEFWHIRCVIVVDAADVGYIFHISPSMTVLVVEATIINMLPNQLHCRLMSPFVHLKDSK